MRAVETEVRIEAPSEKGFDPTSAQIGHFFHGFPLFRTPFEPFWKDDAVNGFCQPQQQVINCRIRVRSFQINSLRGFSSREVEGVDDFDACFFEVSGIACCNGQSVDQGAGGDQTIFDWNRSS
jgi:hypothetical protein